MLSLSLFKTLFPTNLLYQENHTKEGLTINIYLSLRMIVFQTLTSIRIQVKCPFLNIIAAKKKR